MRPGAVLDWFDRGVSASFPIPFGRYQLVERLAVGGMAELFLADVQGDHGFNKRVVIKRILPQLAADPHFTAMFIAEAKITARLMHPKIAQTHRLGRHEGALYIEMEYVDGLDVLAMLRECAHRRVRLPAEVSVFILKEVLDGLDFAHRLTDDAGQPLNIVHRDISPSNVLVSRRGSVKLVDFGIAQAAASEVQTKAGTLKGKYGYMSPEQVMGAGVSSLSDLFSVGVVLSEMLMGRRLFAAPNELDVLLMVRDVNLGRLERYGGHVPADLEVLLRRALKKDPAERFTSAAEMRDALDEWLFQSRLRVGPGRLGELVESLYEDAHRRRRTSMEELGPADMPAIAPLSSVAGEVAVPAAGTEPGRSGSEPEIQGIPLGRSMVLGGGDDMAEVEIELGTPPGPRDTMSPRARTTERELRSGPSTAPPMMAGSSTAPPVLASPTIERERDEDLVLSEEIDIDLSGLDRAAQRTPAGAQRGERRWAALSPPWSRVSPPVRRPSTPLPVRDTDDGIPISIEEQDEQEQHISTQPRGAVARMGVERAASERGGDRAASERGDASVRFPTIRAAVASVSPERRDPASRDFDDSGVPGLVGPAEDIRSGAMRMLTLDEIARAPRPAPPPLEEIFDTPAQQGDLSKSSSIRVMFQLVTSRADGLLVMSVGGIRKEIYLHGGVPTYVSSNMASELFGAYLVGEGAISSGELDMALAMMPHFGGKLGDTLVGLGLMKPLDVFRLLTRQIRHKLIDVCTWSRGAYTWYPGRENKREAFPIDLDPYEVLGAGALALRDDFLWKWSETLHGMRPRAAERPQCRPEQLKIGRIGRDVLLMLDGRATIAELLARKPGNEERLQLLRVLFLFLETGLAVDPAR